MFHDLHLFNQLFLNRFVNKETESFIGLEIAVLIWQFISYFEGERPILVERIDKVARRNSESLSSVIKIIACVLEPSFLLFEIFIIFQVLFEVQCLRVALEYSFDVLVEFLYQSVALVELLQSFVELHFIIKLPPLSAC